MKNSMRFHTYDEATGYLSHIFNEAGYWEAIISWSERTEFEERPYRLILFNPNEGTLRAIRKLHKEVQDEQ